LQFACVYGNHERFYGGACAVGMYVSLFFFLPGFTIRSWEKQELIFILHHGPPCPPIVKGTAKVIENPEFLAVKWNFQL